MAFELPKRRIEELQLQAIKRNVPLEQIIAVQGQNPIATAVNTGSEAIGQVLAKRNQMRQQGEMLARLEQLSGQKLGGFQGLDPSTATSLATKMIDQRASNYNPQQLQALYSGDTNAISTSFPNGVPREAATLASTNNNRDENRALRQQQMQALEAERERNRMEKRSKEKTDIVNKFNSDAGVRKIQSSMDAANNVRELVNSGNPIAANAIPTYMARASGEVGNLSEADKRPFGGSQAILNRLEASLKQMSTGTLTQQNAKFVLDLADKMENSATNNLDRRAKDVSGQYGKASDFLKSDEIYKTLRPIIPAKPKPLPEPGSVDLGGGASYVIRKSK